MADVGDGGALEEIHDPPLALAPDPLHPAGADEGAVGVASGTVVERDRALHGLDDVPERDLVGRPGEDVASARPASRADDPQKSTEGKLERIQMAWVELREE